MIATKEQQQEFERLAKPLIKWLNDNIHPHAHITITPVSAELSEGVMTTYTEEFIKD